MRTSTVINIATIVPFKGTYTFMMKFIGNHEDVVMVRLGDSHITGYADMHTSTSTKYDNKLVCNIEYNNNNYKY